MVVTANHNGGRVDAVFHSLIDQNDEACESTAWQSFGIGKYWEAFGDGLVFLEVYTLQEDGWHRDCTTEVTASAVPPAMLYELLDDLEFPNWEGWDPEFFYPRVMAVHAGVAGP